MGLIREQFYEKPSEFIKDWNTDVISKHQKNKFLINVQAGLVYIKQIGLSNNSYFKDAVVLKKLLSEGKELKEESIPLLEKLILLAEPTLKERIVQLWTNERYKLGAEYRVNWIAVKMLIGFFVVLGIIKLITTI